MEAAAGAGYDLSDRLPSRREQHESQVALEEAANERDRIRPERDRLASELATTRSALESTTAELRAMMQTRSVRAARWLARHGRRLLRTSP
ncbi:MAG: hypothetical protein WAM30_10690 [Candidatus Dormiibacterota bacterium]